MYLKSKTTLLLIEIVAYKYLIYNEIEVLT